MFGPPIALGTLEGFPHPPATGFGWRSQPGETQSGPFLGPEMGVAATFFPRAAVNATVALSAGALLLGVRGEVARDSNVKVLGPWAGMVIGVGLTKQ